MLHSPEKKSEQISPDTEVHLALTPLQPVVFFGFHRRMSVTGTFFFIINTSIIICFWCTLDFFSSSGTVTCLIMTIWILMFNP